MDEARNLVSKIKATISDAELTDRDQGNFDIKMMTFLWFNEGVTPRERKRVELDIQQALSRAPVRIKGRATLETAPDKRPWNKAQAVLLCTMRENVLFTRERFDIGWVSTGIHVWVNSALVACPSCSKLHL